MLVSVIVDTNVVPAPEEVLQLIHCSCSSDEACSSGRCGCCNGMLSSTAFCTFQQVQHITCKNKWTKRAQNSDDEDEECDD